MWLVCGLKFLSNIHRQEQVIMLKIIYILIIECHDELERA